MSEYLRRCQVIAQETMIAGGLVFAIVVQFLFELICCADTLIHLQVTLGLVHYLELRMADLS